MSVSKKIKYINIKLKILLTKNTKGERMLVEIKDSEKRDWGYLCQTKSVLPMLRESEKLLQFEIDSFINIHEDIFCKPALCFQ